MSSIPVADMRVRSDTFAYIGPKAKFPTNTLFLDSAALGTKGANIASAATTDLSTATGDFVDITGGVTITSFGTAPAGAYRMLRFTGTPTLVYNATSMMLPGSVNITFANGDIATFRSLGSGNWKCTGVLRVVPRGDFNVWYATDGSAVAEREIGGSTYFYTNDGDVAFELPDALGGRAYLYPELSLGNKLFLSDGAALATQGTNIASGATTSIGGATGDFVNVTGTSTITSLGTSTAGAMRSVVFTGVLTLTHNATSLILPLGGNIVTMAGDSAIFRCLGTGNWKCVAYARADGRPLIQSQAADTASAATVNIGALTGDFVKITGTTTITAFDTVPAGVERILWFAGVLTLTHNATSLILPTNASIVTEAGDVARFRSLGSGNWRCVAYQRADGRAIATTQAADVASATTLDLSAVAGDFVKVTGTTTITALGTVPAGVQKTLQFTGILTLTHDATSLALPGKTNIVTAVGDVACFRSLGSGNWKCVFYSPLDGSAVNKIQGADIASASNIDLGGNAKGDFVKVTGTTTITQLGSAVPAGKEYTLWFTGTLTLTHNATSLILPTGANITTQTGDIAVVRSIGSNNWKMVNYARVAGTPVALPSVAAFSSLAVGEIAGNGGILQIPYFKGTEDHGSQIVHWDDESMVLDYSEREIGDLNGSTVMDWKNPMPQWTTASPNEISADTNNYAPTVSGRFLRVSTDSSHNVTGLKASPLMANVGGLELYIVNIGGADIVLKHQNASSTAGNRFLCTTGADITLTPNQQAFLWYDAITARWRVSKMN